MMYSAQIQKHQLPSSVESIARIEQIIDEVKESYNIPEELYGNILVSLSEAVNNAIRHGNKLDEKKKIGFSFDFSESELNFTVKDEGDGFDFKNVPDPTHPDNIDKPDGRGIFIMESLTDELEFEDNGSKVHLKFYR